MEITECYWDPREAPAGTAPNAQGLYPYYTITKTRPTGGTVVVRDYITTLAEAEAIVAQHEARAAAVAARIAQYKAAGFEIAPSREGLSRTQIMRGARRLAVLRDGETVLLSDSADVLDLPDPASLVSDEASAADDATAEPAPQQVAPAEQSRGSITDRQVDEILSLIAEGKREEGGWYMGPTDAAGIEALSRTEADLYLSSLRGEY